MSDTEPNQTDSQADAVDYRDRGETYGLPGFLELLRPTHFSGFVYGFAEGWLMSRPWHRLPLMVPFLVVAFGGAGFVWWLVTSPKDRIVAGYEDAVETATAADDMPAVEIYLKSLTALRPEDRRYRFRLALHQLEHGDRSAAVSNLVALTEGAGYTPARMWLVEQALEPEPQVPLDEESVEKLLRIILDREPTNLRANQLLAHIYLKNGQLRVAEDRLRHIVDDVPVAGLPLARIQRMLNRSEKQIRKYLESADVVFQQRLLREPHDVQVRIQRADVAYMLDKPEDAEQLLKEGVALVDSPELRTALATLYSRMALKRVSQSVLNRPLAEKLFARALNVDPGNKTILRSALQMGNAITKISPSVLSEVIQALKAEGSDDLQDQLLLVDTLAAVGRVEEALEILQPLTDRNGDLRQVVVRLLRAADRRSEAEQLLSKMLAELTVDPDADERSKLQSAVRRAEVLALAGQASEAAQLLEANRPPAVPAKTDSTDADREAILFRRRWSRIYSTVCISVYDEKLRANSFSSEDEPITLLTRAFSTGASQVPALERLVTFSCSDHPGADAAGRAVTKILASGNSNADVYTLLGTQALQAGQTSKARTYLERAYSLTQSNPMALNNLALALVRDKSGDAERALKLANAALQVVPEHPDILSTRGEVYVALERWEEARRDFEVALPQRPHSVGSRRLLAQVYDALDESELAAEHRRILGTTDSTDR